MGDDLKKNPVRDADDGNILVLVNRDNLVSSSYKPVDMVTVQGTERLIKREVHIAYLKMKADALAENLEIYIDSAYRSYSTQEKLFTSRGGGERSEHLCAAGSKRTSYGTCH